MITDAEWAEWRDRNIAKHCGVTQPFASGVRKPKVIAVITADPESKVESDATSEATGVESVSTHDGGRGGRHFR